MDLPAVRLLLTSDDPTLKDHASEFLDLANQTHYHNSALISFSWPDLNSQIKNEFPCLIMVHEGSLRMPLVPASSLLHCHWTRPASHSILL